MVVACNCHILDGHWSDWSEYSTCEGCDEYGTGGYKTHTRTCDNPAPAFDGLPCRGCGEESEEREDCSEENTVKFVNDDGIQSETEYQGCYCSIGNFFKNVYLLFSHKKWSNINMNDILNN